MILYIKQAGLLLFVLLLYSIQVQARAADFYTQEGSDPTFTEVMDSGQLPQGKNSGTGFLGAKIKINHDLLKDGPNAHRPLLKEIKIHTLGNSTISRRDFPKWSRWYQEDGNTQIFRLFEGEENVRNSRKLAARIEAFSLFSWEEGDWQEWVGTYTIIKPHGCAIFQAKNPKNDWSVQLNMSSKGDIKINHRRGQDQIIARDMTGKPFHIRIRDNGLEYEVYLNGEKVGAGSWPRPTHKTNFRWGMYLGASPVKHDAMLLVTGAAVNPTTTGDSYVYTPSADSESEIHIPSRVWTNAEGKTIEAEARYDSNSREFTLKVGGRWVAYHPSKLSDSDQKELLRYIEAAR